MFRVFLKSVTSSSVAYSSSILPVNVSNEVNLSLCEPLLDSKLSNLPSCDPLSVSSDPNLFSILLILVFKLPVFVSSEPSLLFCDVLVLSFDEVYELKSDLTLPLSVSKLSILPSKLVISVSKEPVLVSSELSLLS